MIPNERMEQIRHETAQVLDLGVDGEQQSKIKKLLGKKKKGNKKRRPSARLRRKVDALAQAFAHQSPSDESTESDDDDDDEPFIIKQSSAMINGKSKSEPNVYVFE